MDLSRRLQPTVPRPSARRPKDRLTIARLLILTAGVAGGLAVFGPNPKEFEPNNAEQWRLLASALLIGFSMPGPWFAIRRRDGRRLGTGGLLWAALGLGVWLLLPPAIAERLESTSQMGNRSVVVCLFYCLPLMALWTVLAAWAGGRLKGRLWSIATPWRDRFGILLGLAWSILGAWHIVDFYREAFW